MFIEINEEELNKAKEHGLIGYLLLYYSHTELNEIFNTDISLKMYRSYQKNLDNKPGYETTKASHRLRDYARLFFLISVIHPDSNRDLINALKYDDRLSSDIIRTIKLDRL